MNYVYFEDMYVYEVRDMSDNVGVLFFFVDIIIWYIIFYICIIFLVYLFVSVLFFKYMESYLNFVK